MPLRIFCLSLSLLMALPAHAQAENVEPFQQWWCIPLARESVNCTRFFLEESPSRVLSLTVAAEGEGEHFFEQPDAYTGKLLYREIAYLQSHKLENGTLIFAVVGARQGNEIRFTVESPESAVKERSGGSYSDYSRIPALDAFVDTANARFEAEAATRLSGVIRNTQGLELFSLDIDAGMVTPLYEDCLPASPGRIRARTDFWEDGGEKLATIISVAGENGIRYGIELHAENNHLLVTVSGDGYENMKKDPIRKKLMEHISPSFPIMRTVLE